MRLTELSVRHIEIPERGQKIHFDDTLPNFGIRVSYGGTRTWVALIGSEHSRKLISLGRYPALSLKDARAKAREVLVNGILDTPAIETVTWSDALDLFLKERGQELAPRTINDYRYTLERHFPFKKATPKDITSGDLRSRLERLSDRPSEHRHAHAVLRTFVKWMLKREYLANDPLISLPSPPSARDRTRILSEPELALVYRHACNYPFPFGPIVRLLLLTGQRRSEIGTLRREWIDLSERMIIYPAHAVKNRTEHHVPLGTTACTLLQALPHFEPFVFPARQSNSQAEPKPYSGWSKGKVAFDKGLANVAPFTLHDLRRTFSSTQARLGTERHVTEKVLNHLSGEISGVAATYNRYDYLTERRDAMQRIDDYLEQLAIA